MEDLYLKKKLKNMLLSAALAGYAAALIVFSEQAAYDLQRALLRCLNVIIPSLFALMAVSELMVRSRAYIYFSKILAPAAYIIKLPVPLIFVFLMGNFAGYPVGASIITRLFDEGAIDKKSGERLLCTCYNGGPAFFCGIVGICVFSSADAGLLIYFSIVLGNFAAATVLNRLFPIKYNSDRDNGVRFDADMLPDSAAAAGVSLFKICSMIMLFQTVLTLIGETGLSGFFSSQPYGTLTSSVLEITNITNLSGTPFWLMPLVAAAGSFGGLCVIIQVRAALGGKLSMIPFLFARILCAALSAGFCIVLYKFFGNKILEAVSQTKFIVNFNNFLPSVCLIMMIFITVLKKRFAFSENM